MDEGIVVVIRKQHTGSRAATLTAFFAGIAAGNAYWGRRAAKFARPLMVYGVLELCITLSAVLYFAVYFAYDSVYPLLFSVFENAPTIFTLAKFTLALILFFPAAFFMGGTLPIMTQHFVRSQDTLGKRASMLYAINTMGAASGAMVAGFYLPHTLGIDASYLLAMSVTLLVGIGAIVLGRKPRLTDTDAKPASPSVVTDDNSINAHDQTTIVLAGLSGFASLALQVLWVRMFSQVLHNSVYTYSAILSVFLIALAIGGFIARELARRNITEYRLLPPLLTVTSLLIAASPLVFYWLTRGGAYLGGDEDFLGYLLQIVGLVGISIGIPTVAIGILLPFLFKVAEKNQTAPGQTVGRLVTVNTLGAILGSIAAGFFLLSWIGLWASLNAIAAIYIVAALWLLVSRPTQSGVVKFAPIVGVLLLVTVLDAGRLPVVRVDPINKNETLLKVWEGSDATVAVVKRNGHLRTKLNNWYTLGSTGDMVTQTIQTHLPMLLHPNPQRVFYLGLGTGITAGTALGYPIKELVVAEISPSAIRASKEFFEEHTNGLFKDSRVTVTAEDGRNVLRGTSDEFDLIISDLFIPWKAGTGTLYSVEHYETALRRLTPGGMYAQWLPLYQLTEEEFTIIARSMLEVFPRVTLWRGNFSGSRSVVALVGHQDTAVLGKDVALMDASRRALRGLLSGEGDNVPLLAHYAGSLKSGDSRILAAPLNTDSLPIIEYLAPINHRREKAGEVGWFVGHALLEFMVPNIDKSALQNDMYLAGLNPAWFGVIQAGHYLQTSQVLKDQGHEDASAARSTYLSLLKNTASVLAEIQTLNERY